MMLVGILVDFFSHEQRCPLITVRYLQLFDDRLDFRPTQERQRGYQHALSRPDFYHVHFLRVNRISANVLGETV